MEELQKMIADLSVNLKSGLSAVESKLESSHASMESKLASTQASVDATANSLLSLNTWKSGIDNQVSDLNQSMQELRKQVDRVAVGVGLSALGKPPGAAPPPAAPSVQAAEISLQGLNSGQGHGSTHDPRGQTAGSLTLALSTPVTGTNREPLSTAIVSVPDNPSVVAHASVAPPPHAEFPRFDGENPRLWQKACEKYFRLFTVDVSQWVEYSTMHFTGNAAMWLQSVEDRLSNFSWETLCEMIHKRFDRGQYQLLYRQSFKLKQTGSVIEYVEKFDTLMHHMLAYKPDLDPMFFTTRFIEGLARNIRAVVMIQQPLDLETVVALALLQEEIEEDDPKPIQAGYSEKFLQKWFLRVWEQTGNIYR
jgi:hypothetical protein